VTSVICSRQCCHTSVFIIDVTNCNNNWICSNNYYQDFFTLTCRL